MTIGPHILEGKIEKLSAPLVILRRDDDGSVAMAGDVTPSTGVAYTVAGVASQKLLFKSRPKLSLGMR